jgi:hypothetical protein
MKGVPSLALAMRASGFCATLGDGIGWCALTKGFPGESKKGVASGWIDCFEIRDFGEQDTDRITSRDVARWLARGRIREGEENRVPGGRRLSGRHRQNRGAYATSLNLRYPLFGRGVTVHLKLRTMDGGQIKSWFMTPYRIIPHRSMVRSLRTLTAFSHQLSAVGGSDSHDRTTRDHEGDLADGASRSSCSTGEIEGPNERTSGASNLTDMVSDQ